jgi:hypothetical protein
VLKYAYNALGRYEQLRPHNDLGCRIDSASTSNIAALLRICWDLQCSTLHKALIDCNDAVYPAASGIRQANVSSSSAVRAMYGTSKMPPWWDSDSIASTCHNLSAGTCSRIPEKLNIMAKSAYDQLTRTQSLISSGTADLLCLPLKRGKLKVQKFLSSCIARELCS